MLTIKQYKSIHEIDPLHWDSIIGAGDFFHSHNFISVVENSKVENATFFYFLFYDKGTLIATTIFAAFNVSLDLFISNHRLVRSLKRVFPNLFTVKILTCGLPASFGQLNLKVADVKYASEVSSLIVKEMRALAKRLKISLMTVKEFRNQEFNSFNQFQKEGFFPCNSIPYMNLDIVWESFEDYLSSMRHHYRRKIVLSLKKINQLRPSFTANGSGLLGTAPTLVLVEASEDDADDFFKGYLAVMQRTPTKLETLNLQFFNNLFRQNNGCKLLNLVVNGKTISSAVLFFSEDTLTFMLVAREDERDEYDSYFNLIYGMIELAIRSGCKKIKMGQTAYWVKQCVGALPERELLYLASRHSVVHRILKLLRHQIFPDLKLKATDVFRSAKQLEKTKTYAW